MKLEESLDYEKKNYHNTKVKNSKVKNFNSWRIKNHGKREYGKNVVIKQDYLKKHQDGKETFNTFLLKLHWHERSCPGCLSFNPIQCA